MDPRDVLVAAEVGLLDHKAAHAPPQHGAVVFQRDPLALRRLQRQGQYMGGKELALVTRTVTLAVQSRIQAMAQLFNQNAQQLGVCAQAIEPLAVDKHFGAARRPARSKDSHCAAQLLIGGQRQRDATCPLQPVLLYRLGVQQHVGIAALPGEQRLEILGVDLPQKRLHGQAGLPIHRLQPSHTQFTVQAAGQEHIGLRRIDARRLQDAGNNTLAAIVLAQVQLPRYRRRGRCNAELTGLHRLLPQGLWLLHRKSRLQGGGDWRGRQQPARLQPLKGKSACSTCLLLGG